jgi:DNA-directed RNA polymerase specialized sigma24 family protein
MFGATKVGNQRSSPYATTTDFCQIFETDMNRLYRLSFLLTGDEPTAEQCFLGGLQMAKEGNPVFKNWAEAWARRMIILDAIRVLHPQLIVDTSESFGRVAGDRETDRIEIAEIVKLPVFERFVFVISVLEGYSDHECSLHLGCPRAAVVAARVRALERVGRAAELRDKFVSVASTRIKSLDTRNGFSYETINDICHDSGCR